METIQDQQSSLLEDGGEKIDKPVSTTRQPSLKLFIIFSTIYYAGTITFGMFITNINAVLAIVGAVAANCIVYIFPAIFFVQLIKMKELEKDIWNKIAIGVLIFGFICMVASLAGTIIGFAE